MKVVTGSQMGEIDRRAIEEYGIPGIVLMENAGLQVVEAALTLLGDQGTSVTICCGTGNNGGDGLVAARHLSNLGYNVSCFLLGDKKKLSGDALTNYIILTRMGLEPISISDEYYINDLAASILISDLIIDALYGTGFSGVLTGISEQVVELINLAAAPILAVDIPSGLDSYSGQASGAAVRADWTVTMALPKIGLLEPEATPYVGRLTVADISMPPVLLNTAYPKINLITGAEVYQQLPSRAANTHKGDYGHVLIIGGSSDMTGAVVMAAQAAMRMGAGLVTAALPAPARAIAASQIPQAMTLALPANEAGRFAPEALDAILAALADKSVGIIGPGMGCYREGEELIAQIVRHSPVPLVIDADALNMLAINPAVLREARVPIVLTPHPGEMARLTGQSIAHIQGQRKESACNFAGEHSVILVLKGHRTLIATPDQQLFVNTTGNPGMACGGSGDVLSGMIAALLAQGMTAAAAAWVGVYLHGRAGDLAAQEYGQRSMTALDIVSALPQVFKEGEV